MNGLENFVVEASKVLPSKAAKWQEALASIRRVKKSATIEDTKNQFSIALAALMLHEEFTSDEADNAVAELSTYENGKVTQAFNDALAAAIAGEKSAQAALDEAQAQADRILKPYR